MKLKYAVTGLCILALVTCRMEEASATPTIYSAQTEYCYNIKSLSKVVMELRQKGVDKEFIQASLEQPMTLKEKQARDTVLDVIDMSYTFPVVGGEDNKADMVEAFSEYVLNVCRGVK